MDSINLLEDIYPYTKVPKIDLLEDENDLKNLFITDTTLRDGQQARAPYSVDQSVQIFKFLARLGGEQGIIKQTELFLYSKRDIRVLHALRELGFKYPEITAWVRAHERDLELAFQYNFDEIGILTSSSDYHLFYKLGFKSHEEAMVHYLRMAEKILQKGIVPRCHLEDVTRSDIDKFTKPYLEALDELSVRYSIPVKIRLCDTMGFGIPYSNALLPRSVEHLVNTVREAGFASTMIEWHGHNDFHKALANGVTAWLSGADAVNGTLFGFGERTGNPPIDGLAVELAGLWGEDRGMDLSVITEAAEYFNNTLNQPIAHNYPLAGKHFNTTRAGIHIDGTVKNEKIYNIFDTRAILKRPPQIQITDKSGAAGVQMWLEQNGRGQFKKSDPFVLAILDKINEQYEEDRHTAISEQEMIEFCESCYVEPEEK